MRICVRILRRLAFCFETAYAKMRWKDLDVCGLFRKRLDTQITICENGRMQIGKNVSFYRNVSLSSAGGFLHIGNNAFFNRNCIVICHKEIRIEDHVIFGPGVTIYDHDHIFSYEGIRAGYNLGSVVIEEGCWIGANVTILRNTHIGKYSVIGAGAIVQGEIPPHSLVRSNRELSITPIRESVRSLMD